MRDASGIPKAAGSLHVVCSRAWPSCTPVIPAPPSRRAALLRSREPRAKARLDRGIEPPTLRTTT